MANPTPLPHLVEIPQILFFKPSIVKNSTIFFQTFPYPFGGGLGGGVEGFVDR